MTENEAIGVLKNNFPKTCRMIDGIYKGGFNDTECEFGKAILLSILALEEIQQYRAIGTVEECNETKERQRKKKPIKTENDGFRYTDSYICSNCGKGFTGTGIADFCYHCGQSIDWSDTD